VKEKLKNIRMLIFDLIYFCLIYLEVVALKQVKNKSFFLLKTFIGLKQNKINSFDKRKKSRSFTFQLSNNTSEGLIHVPSSSTNQPSVLKQKIWRT
jgi:hypothetical protein